MRRLWDAPISRLHQAVLESAALQIWLDGLESEKGKPNENLGREFLELFSLGDGCYSEADVKAAARALTGFRRGPRDDLRAQAVAFDKGRHDDGEKTILGQTGRWGRADLVRIASAHPCAARHVARRLFVTFIDDIASPPDGLVDALADLIRTPGDVDVSRGIQVVLSSRLFHSEAVRGRKIKSPVDFVIGLIRSTSWFRPPDAGLVDMYLTRMGQTLLDPPSVAGWPAGYAWLGAPLLVARANFVAEITSATAAEGKLRSIAEQQEFASAAAWASAVASAFSPGHAQAGASNSRLSATTFVDALRIITSCPEAYLS